MTKDTINFDEADQLNHIGSLQATEDVSQLQSIDLKKQKSSDEKNQNPKQIVKKADSKMDETNENSASNSSRFYQSMRRYNWSNQLMLSAIQKHRIEKSTLSVIEADASKNLIYSSGLKDKAPNVEKRRVDADKDDVKILD